jgi:hypothetical protein
MAGGTVRHSEVEPDQALIDKALEELLAGSVFRSSRQCQALLRYIVEHSRAHREEMLRERVIGANVFGRAPDYDTGNDPVVRNRAAELRKRLAQHYMRTRDSKGAIRIEIPTGSYRAIFEIEDEIEYRGVLPVHETSVDLSGNVVVQKAAGPDTETVAHAQDMSSQGTRSRWTRWIAGVAMALVVLLGVVWLTIHQVRVERQSKFVAFWAVMMDTQHPVLIIMGANRVYRLNDDFLGRYRVEHHIEDTNYESFIDLRKGDVIDESQFRKIELIGFGDAAAAARLASMLTRFNKHYDLRYGGDIAVTDFQSSPAFLIGGFSNVWTLEAMRQLRFQLEGYDHIVDKKDPSHVWRRKSDPGTLAGDDYVVISRLIKPETGNFILAIAGIDTYSNQAAADFLSDPDRLDALLKTLPTGWERKNMQIVLHTNVVKEVPTAVNVEAWDIW